LSFLIVHLILDLSGFISDKCKIFIVRFARNNVEARRASQKRHEVLSSRGSKEKLPQSARAFWILFVDTKSIEEKYGMIVQRFTLRSA
jgi:hypothetical protein